MIKCILGLMAFIACSGYAHSEDQFKAELVEVSALKGIGEEDACKPEQLIVQEVFRLTGSDLENIVIAHSSGDGPALSVKDADYVVNESNSVVYSYCVEKNYASDTTVRFWNATGKSSNLVKFAVDTLDETSHRNREP